jgi:hypothetical protein
LAARPRQLLLHRLADLGGALLGLLGRRAGGLLGRPAAAAAVSATVSPALLTALPGGLGRLLAHGLAGLLRRVGDVLDRVHHLSGGVLDGAGSLARRLLRRGLDGSSGVLRRAGGLVGGVRDVGSVWLAPAATRPVVVAALPAFLATRPVRFETVPATAAPASSRASSTTS